VVPTVGTSSVTQAYFGNDAAQLKLHNDLMEKLALTSPTASPLVSLALVEQHRYPRLDAVCIPGGHASKEDQAKPKLGGGEMKFYPQTGLERAGARFSSNTTPWTGHVVVDRELITGQNPASALEVGQRLVDRLN